MENRCKFWLPKKNRFCANAPLHNSSFCGNHTPRTAGQWIPCPIDPSHLNISQFFELIRKIESVHAQICKDIKDSYKIPEACGIWIKREVDRKLPFQEKHVMQQASILGNLEEFGVLESSDGKEQCGGAEVEQVEDSNGVPAVVEFGAGRGYLTQMLADCYGIGRVFLVERKSYKLKADRSLRQKESLILERLRIDIEDLNLNAVESLQGLPYVAIGKHLCGPATDKKYLTHLGISKEEFHAITWFTSWAVDADHGSDLSDVTDFKLHPDSIGSEKEEYSGDANGVEGMARNMKAIERAKLGFMCKQIIDMGRLMWVKEHGLVTQLVKYVPATISPENHLLIARHVCHF
ncbi:Methyltransferase TRM13 - like 1 [Theobroma cacao]|nr:Methyltransferase TRM13 - like 1 [Theobroma cacao]